MKATYYILYSFCILCFMALTGSQYANPTSNSPANDSFEYAISSDQKVLTFYDPKWKQLYRVTGLAELPSDINSKGDLWYMEGFLSIRQGADSYLSFRTKEMETPDGTSFRVKSIARYMGPEIDSYIKKVRSVEGMTLSDIEPGISCTCIEEELIKSTPCSSGGTYATGCGVGENGNACEVSCGEGFTACCKD